MRDDRPSSTARLIARSIVLAARDPDLRVLVAPGEADALRAILAACARPGWFEFTAARPWLARGLWRLERLALPGIVAHYLARKRWLERAAATALAAGVEQVVVLGAGFDLLGWRSHRTHPTVLFCELDHPATQRPKTAGLAGAAANFIQRPLDLGKDLPSAALSRIPQFNPQRPTLFIAEGLFMYFSAERVGAVLRDLRAFPRATLAFTFMEPGPDGRATFRGGNRLIHSWLRSVREPFAWSLPREALPPFLAEHGWRLESFAAATELRAAILAPAGLRGIPLAEGECLCTATCLA